MVSILFQAYVLFFFIIIIYYFMLYNKNCVNDYFKQMLSFPKKKKVDALFFFIIIIFYILFLGHVMHHKYS